MNLITWITLFCMMIGIASLCLANIYSIFTDLYFKGVFYGIMGIIFIIVSLLFEGNEEKLLKLLYKKEKVSGPSKRKKPIAFSGPKYPKKRRRR